MRQVDSKIYDKDYYFKTCLGSEEFIASGGLSLNEKWKSILKLIEFKKGMRVLDLGCGRGDVAIYLAGKGVEVIGVDYSKDAIEIAKISLSKTKQNIKKLITYINMDAKKMSFDKDYFDAIVSFDFLEHIYKEEAEVVMLNVSKILKKNGILLAHTETNKIFLDYTHPFYIYPVSNLIVHLYNKLTGKSYPGFPKDPRNEFHIKQHVNEPTVFYLKNLFKRYKLEGRIIQKLGVYKPIISWKDIIFNIIVCLYPFSKIFPLNILFATEYICIYSNKKQ